MPRELLLIVGLVAVLGIAAALLRPGTDGQGGPGLSSHSGAPGGALGLYLWLEQLGYRVERLEYRAFQLQDDEKVLFILAPTVPPDAVELNALRDWVETGGTLILAGDAMQPDLAETPLLDAMARQTALNRILGKLGLSEDRLADRLAVATPIQPLLEQPPVGTVTVQTGAGIRATSALVPYLGDAGRPVAASVAIGQGTVFVVASNFAFSNEGLRQTDNAALALNWLPAPNDGVGVAFDEVHHGLSESRSLVQLMVHQPWGWAILYALGMCLVYLLIGGRRFGRSVSVATDGRREAAEYVVSLAGLLRRGNKREWVARHYEQGLRRQLAESFGCEPGTEPAVIASRLSEIGPASGVEGAEVARLLAGLRDKGPYDERQLVRLAAGVDVIVKAIRRRRL